MEETVLQSIFSAAFLGSILRVTTPILLPSLGASVTPHSPGCVSGLHPGIQIPQSGGVIWGPVGPSNEGFWTAKFCEKSILNDDNMNKEKWSSFFILQ